MAKARATACQLLDVRRAVTLSPPDVAISARALDAIAHESARSSDGLETGGILLGYDTGPAITIQVAGDPGPNARRGARTFLRDRAHAQRLAATAWEEDQSQWIGEWHTHPTGDLVPSSLDVSSYLTHLRDPELDLTRFVAVIGQLAEDGRVLIAAWIVDLKYATMVEIRHLPTEGSGV